MAHPNPAQDRHHVVETYRSRARASRRVAQVNGAGFHAYMVVGRQTVVHISEGKRQDLSALPKIGGPR
jgi:hypothetical protein